MAWNGKFSANQKRETLKRKVSVKLKQCRVILTSYTVTLFKSARRLLAGFVLFDIFAFIFAFS